MDKYLTAVFLLCLQNEGAVSPRLRELLFRRYRLADAALRGAGRALPGGQRPGLSLLLLPGVALPAPVRASRDLAREARRFYRLGQREKLERIANLPCMTDPEADERRRLRAAAHGRGPHHATSWPRAG